MKKKFRSIGRLEIVSFVTGFSLLAFELIAARILAPTIGSSTYVWTSVIGMIIAALSLGFYVGGRLADRRERASDVVWLLSLAALGIVVTKVIYEMILGGIATTELDARVQAVVASLVLFVPTSFLIGMTSPYLAKLNVRSLHTSGRAVASLDMFNAMGGITGTFVTGFVLFGYIGSQQSLGLVAGLLLAVSWLLLARYQWQLRLGFSLALVIVLLIPPPQTAWAVSIDTPSANYQVVDMEVDSRPATVLITGPHGAQSAVYTSGPNDLVFWYAQEMARLAIEQEPRDILILGGGAFTLPGYLATALPESQIDVVEIDPQLETISREHFRYESPANVKEIAADARTFVNQAEQRYDLILVDVYGDNHIPFSLMTREFTAQLAELVRPDGRVIANVIAGETGPCRQILTAIDAVYRREFPTAVFTNESGRFEPRANYLLIYGDTEPKPDGFWPLPALGGTAYSDNFAPAERLHQACLRAGSS